MYKLFFIIVLFATSCVSRNNSTSNESFFDKTKIGKIKNVVILGNSIVSHAPLSEIGWNNDWGMAASIRDSDFVHILKARIINIDSSVIVRYANIASFENNYESFDLTSLDSLKNPDMLIVRIAENVNDENDSYKHFLDCYSKLIKQIDSSGKSVKIIVDGFWGKSKLNNDLKNYAYRHKYAFTTTTDLSTDTSNLAGSRFKNAGVAAHPSDKGMRLIADRIWFLVAKYFNR